MTKNPLSPFGSQPLAINYDQYDHPYGEQAPYEVCGGIAVIDICGALAKDPAVMEQLMFGACSYIDIENQVELAAADSSVSAIMLRINSPGGSVGGMFQTANSISAAGKVKKIWVVADDMACSAAYLLASAADRIYIGAETGMVGSIGILAQRFDLTQMDKTTGIKVNLIAAGSKKIYGNPHAPMSQDEQTTIQAEVDRIYGLFVDAVARNRTLTPESIRAEEAAVYTGQSAIDAGLADRLGTFDSAMTDLSALVAKSKNIFSMTATAAMNSKKEVSVMDGNTESQTVVEINSPAPVEAVVAQVDASAPLKAADAITDAALTADAAHEIAELCAIAGRKDLVADFVLQRRSVAEVRKVLVDAKADLQGAVELNGRTLPNTSTKTNVEDEPIVKACVGIAAAMKGAKQHHG